MGLKKARLKTRPYAAKLPFEEPSSGGELRPTYLPTLDMPSRHALAADIDPRRLEPILLTTYERAPQDFETLWHGGCRRATLRALALVSEAIYGYVGELGRSTRCIAR